MCYCQLLTYSAQRHTKMTRFIRIFLLHWGLSIKALVQSVVLNNAIVSLKIPRSFKKATDMWASVLYGVRSRGC